MVKQQHYVPRCYLKNFVNSKGQIGVYDKSTDKVFFSKPEGIASEKFFYDVENIDEAVGRDQFIEKALSILEGQAASVFEELLGKLNENHFTRLHPDEKYFLAHFIAIQMLRTREYRIQIQQMSDILSACVHSNLTEEMKAAFPKQIPPLKISESELAELQGMSLSDPKLLTKHADILDSHFWIVLRAVSGQTFLTSDHPVAKKANIRNPFRSMSGIASKGIEVTFPLSPDYCVCLHERTHFEKQFPGFKMFENRVHELKDAPNMDYYNHLQIMHSNRFLFSINDDFAFAKTVCDEEPHWRNQSRQRVASDKNSELNSSAPAGLG